MAKASGAQLVRYGLEQLGIAYTLGIPGVHNTEMYDELGKSNAITPILVTHEAAGSFMADAISRTSDSVGCLLIVPAAGAAYASAGIGEAYLDGIPLLVISGGTRTDTPYSYQLHQMDQCQMMAPISKAQYKIEQHSDILPALYEAYETATQGEPGPVFIEVPVNIQLFKQAADYLSFKEYLNAKESPYAPPSAQPDELKAAASLLIAAKKPGIFVGWGARKASEAVKQLAEKLNAPVASSLQGLASFPADHPLHTGMSFGPASVPASENAFKDCDCLLAIGVRFGEIATGSFGVTVPENLIHIDINQQVFNANYPAKLALHSDASLALESLLPLLEKEIIDNQRTGIAEQIAADKLRYQNEWLKHNSKSRVNPAHFFNDLSEQLNSDAIIVLDDGNHTFLAAELLPVKTGMRLISPTDFNCMGYAVPAAIGAKLLNPAQQVVAIIGDGCFSMTCMEIITATKLGLGIVFCIFNDGELAQISQAQALPYNRKPCTQLPAVDFNGVAIATGAAYHSCDAESDLTEVFNTAHTQALAGQPVIIDVKIDYSKKTRFTKGILATNLKRMKGKDKSRFITRAIKRKLLG